MSIHLNRNSLPLFIFAIFSLSLPVAAQTPPGVPQNLVLSAPGHASITATWEAPADNADGITNYRLQWKRSDLTTSFTEVTLTLADGAGNLTSSVSVGGDGTHTYDFRVAAAVGTTVGEFTEVVQAVAVLRQVSADDMRPLPVSPLFSTPTGTAFTAGWLPSTGLNLLDPPYRWRYRVKSPLTAWLPGDGGDFTTGAATDAATCVTNIGGMEADYPDGCFTIGISGLNADVTYDFQARTVNSTGAGAWSTLADVATTGMAAAAPSSPSAVSAVENGSNLDVSWTAATGSVTDYRVRWRIAAAGAAENAWQGSITDADGTLGIGDSPDGASIGGTGTTHSIAAITAGEVYQVEVAAVNAATLGAWARNIPASPPDLTLTPAHAQITATWTAPAHTGGSAITGYKIRWKTGSDPYGTPADSTSPPHVISGLTNDSVYDVQVAAETAVGIGEYSAAVQATPVISAPNPPQNITLAASDAQIVVAWAAPANDGGSAITGYKVRWKLATADYSGVTPEVISDAATLTHTISNATNDAEYDVSVAATNAQGDSEWSADLQATPSAELPGKLTFVTTVASSNTPRWEPSTAPVLPSSRNDAYQVRYRIESPLGEWILIPDSSIRTDNQGLLDARVDGELIVNFPAVTFAYQVRAVNNNGAGPWSDIWVGKPLPSATAATPPSAPTVTDAPTVAADTGDVTINWTAPATGSVTDYRVRWRISAAGAAENPWQGWISDAAGEISIGDSDDGISIAAAAATAYTITGLNPALEYDVAVAAVNVASISPWATNTPAAPQNLSLSAGDSQLTAAWEPPATDGGFAISGYKLRWKLRAAAQYGASVDVAGTTHTITNLANLSVYDVQVAAMSEIGVGVYSAAAEGKPFDAAALPGKLTLWVGAAGTGFNVVWPRSAAANLLDPAYRLRYRVKSPLSAWLPEDIGEEVVGTELGANTAGCAFALTPINNADYPQGCLRFWLASPSPLAPAAFYQVQIRAVNSNGAGEWSDLTSFSEQKPGGTKLPAPAAVTDFIAAADTETSINLNWTAPGGTVTDYRVRWRIAGDSPESPWQGWISDSAGDISIGDSNQGISTAADTAAYTLTRLAPNTNYDVDVAAVNAASLGPWSGAAAEVTRTNARATAPKNVMPRAVGVDMTLTWSAPFSAGGSAISEYKIRWKLADETDYPPENTTAAAAAADLIHTIPGLDNPVDYVVSVAAVNVGGEGPYSADAAPPSITATLAGLTMTGGEFIPEFGAEILAYTASLPFATSMVTVTPTVTDTGLATVSVDDTAVGDATASGDITLAAGEITAIEIVVTAEDGTTTQTYTLNLTRAIDPATRKQIDVNADGVADEKDGLLLVRYFLGLRGSELTADGLGGANPGGIAIIETAIAAEDAAKTLDVNADSEVTAADAILIARFLLGVEEGAGLTDGQFAETTSGVSGATVTVTETDVIDNIDSLKTTTATP